VAAQTVKHAAGEQEPVNMAAATARHGSRYPPPIVDDQVQDAEDIGNVLRED
jgi:hypothetical protein